MPGSPPEVEHSSWLQVQAQAQDKEETQSAVTPLGGREVGARAYAGHRRPLGSPLLLSCRSPSPVGGRGRGGGLLGQELEMQQLLPGTRPEGGRPSLGRRRAPEALCVWS